MTMVMSANAHNTHYPTYTIDGITYEMDGSWDGCGTYFWRVQKVHKSNNKTIEKYYFDKVWGEIDNIYAIDEMNSATTSINSITNETMENDAWYTINGTKIDNPTKGIYIKNGKKYIIK